MRVAVGGVIQESKQAHHIRMKDGRPFALAGLWERWHGAEGEPIESCTIIATAANELLRLVLDRMPVIRASEDYGKWLDPTTPAEQLHALLRPYRAAAMEAVPVGSYVSNPRNEGRQCVAS
jgi:putative SOS response-associated peptidase YedK